MDVVEKELVKFSGFKKKASEYEDRQEYLVALLKAISVAADKDDQGWDNISDEAANWYDNAVRSQIRKEELPDFGIEEVAEPEQADGPDDEDEPEDDAGPDTEDEPEDEAGGESSVDEPASDSDAGEETEEQPKAKPEEAAKPAKKVARTPKPKVEKQEADAEVSEEPKPKAKQKRPTAGKGLPRVYTTTEKDAYGITLGTKTHDAIMMYERGATRPEVTKELGGKFYNVLKDLAKLGHRVEKDPNGKIFLTHKDKLEKPKKGKDKA